MTNLRRKGWQRRYMQTFYNPASGWVDGTEEFHKLCAEKITGGRILEIGAGPNNSTSAFLAGLGELHGLDPDPDVKTNSSLQTATVLSDERYPYDDASFDACVSNYVLEHVADAAGHLREIARILKPGGAYVFRTPNRFHYVAVVSALTPDWFHKAVANPLRNFGADAHDPYPTKYALNSRKAIRAMAPQSGLLVESLRMVEKEPSYGMYSRLLFLAFTGYERLVNATAVTEEFRANIFGTLRKPTG